MDLHTVAELAPATTPSAFRPGDAWLAGGTFLFSEPQPGVRRLHDLHALGWEPLVEDDDGLHVAATCTVTQLARWGAEAVRAGRHRAAGLVGQCADAFLAGWKVQGVATVGGNVVTALPAAPMVSLAASLDGVALLLAPDGSTRRVPVADLVTGDHTTALAPGELLREVLLPAASLASRTAFRRVSLTPLGRSASLVVARLDDGAGGALVVTVTAATRAPLQRRWRVPGDVDGQGAAAALDAAADGGEPRRTWHDDVHGHPAWRRAMALRGVAEAVDEVLGARA